MYGQKPRRLTSFHYKGRLAYSLRFCTFGRARVFVHAGVVDEVLLQFLRAARETGVAIVAYCFMPDHVHVLVEGTRDDADGRRFIALAKQYSGYGFARRHGRPLWQRFSYERVLRSEEALEDIARYILNNPPRAGLVDRAEDYPFLGSFTHDVKELLQGRYVRVSRRDLAGSG